MTEKSGTDDKEQKKGIKIEELGDFESAPETYSSLVSGRLKKREKNIMGTLEDMLEDQMRFTVRIFADCMEEEEMTRFLAGYSEYLVEDEMREIIEEFVPKYTEYALSELEAKKRESEDFDAEHLTGEELQEMAIKEKWPRIAEKPEVFSHLRLIREIAKLALCVRPYMLTDPGWNESLLEYALYFEIQDSMRGKNRGELHDMVGEIGLLIAEAENTRAIKEKEEILGTVREKVLTFAGIEGTVEERIGEPMERYPREAPEGWDLAEFRHNLMKLSPKELQLSALVYIEILTLEEMEEFSKPYLKKYSSFFEMDKETLVDYICALVFAIGDREILNFYERYKKGKMMVSRSIDHVTWNLMPREEKLQYLRQDNQEMDLALMARHVARIYMSDMYSKLYNYDHHIDLVKNPDYMKIQGYLVQELGEKEEGMVLRDLNDRITVAMLDVVLSESGMREKFASLRKEIGKALGVQEK